PKTFNDYLAGKPLKGQTKKGTKDAWTTRAAILANPTMKKPTKPPHDSPAGLMGGGNVFPKGVGINQPGDVVFFEQPSTLRKKNGAKIKKGRSVRSTATLKKRSPTGSKTRQSRIASSKWQTRNALLRSPRQR